MNTAEATVTLANASVAHPGLPPVQGLEPVLIGALNALSDGDWWVPGPREAVGGVLRGLSESRVGVGSVPYRVAPASAAAGLRALYAVGLALTGARALVHLGIGSVSDGAFYEALNLAALQQANVVFLVAVHPLDGDAPLGAQVATDVQGVAAGLGVNSLQAAFDAKSVESTVNKALALGGPVVVVVPLQPNASA